jgi:hypothetical protein
MRIATVLAPSPGPMLSLVEAVLGRAGELRGRRHAPWQALSLSGRHNLKLRPPGGIGPL